METKEYTPGQIIYAHHEMQKNGIESYNKKSLVRTLLGSAMIVVGVLTFMVPFTTIPLCIGGGVLLGYDTRRLFKRFKYELNLWRMRL